LAAYNWLVDISILKVIDNPTGATITEAFCASNFLPLFKVAKLFGVIVSPARSSQLKAIEESVAALILGLQQKSVIPLSIDASQIVRKDRSAVGKLIVSLHRSGLKIRKVPAASLQELSRWLLSLGLVPPNGDEWFAGGKSLSVADDTVRNGDLLRSLCLVFRPEIYEAILPPVTTTREMIERNRQSLVILAQEGAVPEVDIDLAESVVKGVPDAIDQILRSIKNQWRKRLKLASEAIAGKLTITALLEDDPPA
jgi:hypothetical protein